MEVAFSYYHLLTIFLGVAWALIFATRPELRRELLILGILSIFLLPVIFAIDQLTTDESMGIARISLTDLAFAFSLSGIAGGAYHSLFGKHYHKLPKFERQPKKMEASLAQTWILRFFVAFLIFVWTSILLTLIFGMEIPTAFFLSAVMITIYMLSHRQDLIADAIWSSFLTTFIVFLSTLLASTFAASDVQIAPVISDVLFLGVPLDLLLWSAGAGLALGPLYEFIRTFELK